MEDNDLKLKLRISISDKDVRNAIGAESFNNLFDKALLETRGSCDGCGYKPLDDSKTKTILSLHILDFNPESPDETKGVPLCRACHMTQHIDVAIEKDWVELVNSTYSQKTLIELCRINSLHNNVNADNTRKLRTTPKDFLEKIKLGTLFPSSKAKVIYTSNFSWGDL